MDELTSGQQLVLDAIDEQLARLEKKLAKVQPLINERDKLQQTRRVLLSEKGNTGGGGNSARTQLTQEEVINFMQNAEGPIQPKDITDALGVAGTIVRAHLNRHKGTTYELSEDGWTLVDDGEE